MNSFTLTAVGQLARNPELVAKGNVTYTRFCLVGNDYAGKDEEGAAREIVTTLWFVAFGALGEAVARHARKGDQLFVEARVRGSNWTDKQGEKQYDHSFLVQGFRFGAPGRTKREEREARREDGQGQPRTDERANGRNRSANNGAYLSLGEGAGVVSRARTASEPQSPTAAATASAATAADEAVRGQNEPVGDSEDVAANTEESSTARADANPAGTDSTPADSDSNPAGADAIPAGTDSIPAGADAIPAGTDSNPAGADAIPAGTDSMPAAADAIPAGTDSMPGGAHSVLSGRRRVQGAGATAAAATATRAGQKASGSRSTRRTASAA